MLDLFKDSKDGKLSHSKIGVIIAGAIFSAKMAGTPGMPDDPWLWVVFMSTIGGYAALLKLVAKKYA